MFDYILDKSGVLNKFTHSIKINDDNSVQKRKQNIGKLRSNIVVICCDGLPHLIALDVIENCYICKECNAKIKSLKSVTDHKNKSNHSEFYMQYGQIILQIGGLHMNLTMHRCFVTLNWHINYSPIANFANFKSPKAQLVIQKVSDLHKSNDIFMASRGA